MSSNPATAVAPFGKALYLIAKSFGGDSKPSVPCIGESHPMHVKEPTLPIAKSRRNPDEVVSQTYGKRVYDVDPSWFTLEGYTQQCVTYKRRQPGI